MNIFQKIIELLTKIFSRKYPTSPSALPPSSQVVLTPLSPDLSTLAPWPVGPMSSKFATPFSKNSEYFNTLDDPGMPIINAEQLKRIISTLSDSKCKEILPFLLQTMKEFEINTLLRIAAFIAQTAHESAGYAVFLENLNYSAEALLKTWPSRFTRESAAVCARQPQKIANRVYCNRLGNGDEVSGDGWRYRGRGVIQITGRSNYQECGIGLGLDLISFPELLEHPVNAFRSAGLYWKSHKCHAFADSGNFVGLTKAINGALNGLDDRKVYYVRAKSVFGIV